MLAKASRVELSKKTSYNVSMANIEHRDKEGFPFIKEVFDTVSGFDGDRKEAVIEQMARSEWQRLRYPEDWSAPLHITDLEALDLHPQLSVLIADFPDIVRGEAKDFFTRALRAGVNFDPGNSLGKSF